MRNHSRSKRSLLQTIFLLIGCLIVESCIEPVDLELGEDPKLVVDGSITDQPGPHYVSLSYSTGFNKNPIFVPFRAEVLKATILLIDDLNNVEVLSEIANARYKTSNNFKGVIGRTYHLEITLRNGLKYQSLPETIQPVPSIDQLSFVVEQRDFSTDISVSSEDFVIIQADFKDDEGIDNYYRWRYQQTYEVVAPLVPDTCTARIINEVFTPCPENTRNCWANSFDNEYLRISDDLLMNGRNVKNLEIYAEKSSRKFNLGFSTLVEQHSLTEGAYKYFKSLKEQIGNTGTIFETPNYQIRGNISSVDNPNEPVLGYFSVSAVSKKRLFIGPTEFNSELGDIDCTPNQNGDFPAACLDCRAWPATNVRPEFWPSIL